MYKDKTYKYISKYKNKYLRLKNQLGGADSENDITFSLLSFNILNPYEKVSNITFNNLVKLLIDSDETDTLFSKIYKLIPPDNYILNTFCEIIALADKKRYVEQRLPSILDIISKYITKSMIFLQEVDQYTLDKLKEIYNSSHHIFYNQEPDKLINKFGSKSTDYSRVEYRVVIIPKDIYKVNTTKDIPFKIDNDKNTIQKNGVYVEIENISNNIIYKLLNVHFHYTFTPDLISSFIPIISSEIEYKPSDNFIIAGDTNKKLGELSSLISSFNLNINNQDESIPTFIKSTDLSQSPDHILGSNILGNIKIIQDDNDKKIMYDTNLINDDLITCLLHNKELINGATKEKKSIFDYNKESAELLIDTLCKILSTSKNYISDHNPILLEIR